MQHKSQFGFLTFAQNTQNIDYLQLAYLQALNIKATQGHVEYAVIVDADTATQITEIHKRVFDYIIELPRDYAATDAWKLSNEWQVFWLTPFKETIKLESDLLFTTSIMHWLPLLRTRDVVLSTGCKNYLGQRSNRRDYRRLFDDNSLPDVYNGLMYFRYSQIASDFFTLAGQLFRNWDQIKNQVLKNCREDSPSTDVIYALTAKTIGVENCTVPSADHINFAHMKPGIQGWNEAGAWTEVVPNEFDSGMIRINNINQYWPVHYYVKDYASEKLIKYYEQRNRIN